MNINLESQNVYIMKNSVGLYKIGISNNPERRLRQIENSSGLDVSIVRLFSVKTKARSVEAFLHEKLKDYRKNGEWFSFDNAVLEETIPKLIFYAENPTVVYKETKAGKLIKDLINYDYERLSECNYCEEIFKVQYNRLDNLYKRDYKTFCEVIDWLDDNGYYIDAYIRYARSQKGSYVNIDRCFSVALYTYPIVLVCQINSVKSGYIRHIIDVYTKELLRLQEDMLNGEFDE